ncbi:MULTISPECIES: fumarylacetoacetate hydrolase family protein [Caballeronia]|jgi:2-keto-4-pentenoate hydratase/2-oxohepta-3-ene-1,7-dioic acid hydratase in catechol pathway|uniref:fumarylacetoacetate hydrolase family protein n=1 Tax=Caballeronia TaxID=1827195 RepID=UPI001FD31846|nr:MULTISPECIES: fumarylacetoacetate hydrolase family protein [Caballeronia]
MNRDTFANVPAYPVLVTYESSRGARTGVLVRDRIYDLAGASGKEAYADMKAVLESWPDVEPWLASFDSARAGESLVQRSVRLLPPIANPGGIYGAGANYTDHAEEMAKIAGSDTPTARGDRSWHFLKSSHSIVGPEATVSLPEGATSIDWEVELAAVIGRQGKNIALEDALNHVAAYTVAIDFSARDWSRRTDLSERSPFRMDWLSHKSFDGACPIGPWLVPASRVPDPQDLALQLSVNEVVKQNSNTGKMIFSLAEQIRDLSTRITLWPGDLVLTGTPAGVGSSRGEFLRNGDVVDAAVSGLGILRVKISA